MTFHSAKNKANKRFFLQERR